MENQEQEGVRIDRWLVAVRIFKTRSIASKAITGGKVKVNGDSVKPHKLVKPDDVITMKNDGRTFEYKVVKLLEKRVGAKDAQACYVLTQDSDLPDEMRDLMKLYLQQAPPKPKGRPTKKDRRALDALKHGSD